MTKAEWDQVRASLSFAYGRVELLVDGYKVTLAVQKAAALKYEIFPYVNGEFKGIWLRDKTDEAVRFMCPKTISLFKPAEKKRLTKGLTKKLIKEWLPEIDAKKTYYVWGWSSFASLKAHLIKNNKSIELVKPEPAAPEQGATE